MKTMSFGERIFYKVNYVILGLMGIICLAPILHIISLAFSDKHAVASGHVGIWPVGLTIDSFKLLLEGTNVMAAFKNSIVITVFGVLFSMTATILAAYPLSKRYLIGRKFFSKLLVFTMMFGGGIIPSYMVIRYLGLLNSYGALWIPGLVSTYNMLVMKTFFEGIPGDMEEAARIDGCGELRLLIRIYLPLSPAVIATLTLFYGVGYWNLFMPVLMYITKAAKYNLAVLVQNMIQSQTMLQDLKHMNPEDQQAITPEGLKAAGIVVMVLPMMVVYPFIQKYFVKGVMIGAIKG